MAKTWILVANGHRARFFERDAATAPLGELADFVYPHASLASAPRASDVSGDAGKGHGRTGHGGTQFEPHTAVDAKEHHSFARQLADYVNHGVSEHRCGGLELIASGPMLGEIKPLLSHAATQALHHSVAMDLTSYQGADLRHRVQEALSLPT